MNCDRLIELSRSNSLRALYGEGGLSRTRPCRKRASMTFVSPSGRRRTLCLRHAEEEFLSAGSIDPWTIEVVR